MGILLGYSDVGYRVLVNNRIIVTRHVDIVEKNIKYINLDEDEPAYLFPSTSTLELSRGEDSDHENNLNDSVFESTDEDDEVKIDKENGNQINLNQEINCEVTLNGVIKQLRCFVTANSDLNIMGLDWIAAFDLWQCSLNSFCSKIHSQADSTHFDISFIKENFKEVFSSQLGRCTKTKVKLNLKNNSKPIFRPKRPVAYAILPLVGAEFTRLEQNGIISPIKYSNWVTPIVVLRKKNGNIRICPDFSTGLNESLEPNRYPLPLPDEIFSQLLNCKYFSQLDLSDAFLQIEIDEQSKHLLTINTHRGLYVYNRLPFGVTTAPGEFQSIIDSMISGLENVFVYIDDIVVGGATVQEHNQNLTYLLERIKDCGLHLQIEKCCFFTTQINYLSYVIDGQGLHPDPTKVEAIKNMPEPHNLTTLPADASNEGLGACILHRFPDHSIKAISLASRSLTEAEHLFSVLNESLQSFPITFQQIKEATKEDDILQKVINFTLNSWPQKVDDSDLQPFFRRRNSLTVIQECLLFNDRVVIPQQFHQQILKQIHKGHPGMERMKIIARSYVLLSSWSLPEKPWQRVHIDFAGPLNGEYYFVLVDAFSKWPEIVPTQTITAQQTIEILQEIFARFGVPESLVSDNGTQFTSEKFQNFCLLQGIKKAENAFWSFGDLPMIVVGYGASAEVLPPNSSYSNLFLVGGDLFSLLAVGETTEHKNTAQPPALIVNYRQNPSSGSS
ncbi:PREDICTED: uncharacterized protein K02A2.6-like [Cyphomyrmex costatus]|uniref:uncharacterized protein K02A2.6-like n=1 Tax=Cyphomyrmex costatus TaxID=456900 RepID=UPI0008523790|nr:PREDICTED: uncharacterized protein K02A2.6-like [Cyphomyrmex costatus]